MVRFVLILAVSFSAYADLFDFVEGKGRENRLPNLVAKLKGLEMNDGPAFEDTFNQTVKGIEQAVEEEKLFCTGESADSEGKTIPNDQKQLCLRQLKKNYLEANGAIFEMKRKYLNLIHQRQLKRLEEVQAKLKADIEKNF
jgi:hypothetical protein